MLRRTIVVVLISVVLAASAAIGVAQEPDPSVTVRIAKTNRAVRPFGTVEGAGGDAVVVRLFRYRNSAYRHVDSVRVPVDDDSYRARFRRPTKGDCRVKVRVVRSDARDQEDFPCYIPDFGTGRATMTSVPSAPVEIDVLIADDNVERGYGLMYRPKLPADLGMAFLWDSDTQGGFWMKNTLIPLSIAFFDSRGMIVRILDMEPCTRDNCPTYDPEVSYRGALEVNQGAFEEWGISEGDQIEVRPDG